MFERCSKSVFQMPQYHIDIGSGKDRWDAVENIVRRGPINKTLYKPSENYRKTICYRLDSTV